MQKKILIIEDDKIMRVTLVDYLKSCGYEVQAYGMAMAGMTALNEEEFSLVISDVRLPDMEGLEVLKMIKSIDADAMVLMITAFGTIKDAVEAMKLGAFDYITKPFSLDELALIVQRTLEIKELRAENVRLRRDLSQCYGFPDFVGESAAMQKVYERIQKVAQTDSTVLILGENGTGKELVASTIHYQSNRMKEPYITVNCAALPENLVESELFGYEKGAFTGAAKRKPGRFERADNGTIFLDEIGDLPPLVQIKLLRILQDGSFERLGGTETLKVDVRVLAATNKNLQDEMKSGAFREDLYYRLDVISIVVPPLRERKEDIPMLIEHFLRKYNTKFGNMVTLDAEATNILMKYEFPGNVRELENILERCVALTVEGTASADAFPSRLVKDKKDRSPKSSLHKVAADAERAHITSILKSTKGNKTNTAEILGISRKTLWEKIKAYNIT